MPSSILSQSSWSSVSSSFGNGVMVTELLDLTSGALTNTSSGNDNLWLVTAEFLFLAVNLFDGASLYLGYSLRVAAVLTIWVPFTAKLSLFIFMGILSFCIVYAFLVFCVSISIIPLIVCKLSLVECSGSFSSR